eukprot:scaffold1724_cov341-Pavlova_lutheri.AAC.39
MNGTGEVTGSLVPVLVPTMQGLQLPGPPWASGDSIKKPSQLVLYSLLLLSNQPQLETAVEKQHCGKHPTSPGLSGRKEVATGRVPSAEHLLSSL